MKIGTTWIGIGLGIVVGTAGLTAGCGGGQKAPASYADISSSFAHPTGTLAATNADAVGKAYETSLASGLGTTGLATFKTPVPAVRPVAASQVNTTTSALESTSRAATVAETIPCPNGGSISVSVNGASAVSVSETFSYNNCCESAGCCLNGSGNLFYAQAGSFCESLSISGVCAATPIDLDYSICEDGTTGTLKYLVEVQGESFAVSGSYSNGTGTLSITGKNGSFTCKYTSHTGSCTGTSGTFAF